jgi:hypothetical protein
VREEGVEAERLRSLPSGPEWYAALLTSSIHTAIEERSSLPRILTTCARAVSERFGVAARAMAWWPSEAQG